MAQPAPTDIPSLLNALPTPQSVNTQVAPSLNAYTSAANNYNTSAVADNTLPAALLSSFVKTGEPNDSPFVSGVQGANDTAASIQQNASTNPSYQSVTLPNGVSVPLGGAAQLAGRTGEAQAAGVSASDSNTELSLLNQGILNETSQLASEHAAQTQNLLDLANKAYNVYQTQSSNAMGLAQIAATEDQLKLQYATSPLMLAQSYLPKVQAAAKTSSNFESFAQQFLQDPNYTASGGNVETLFSTYLQAHPGYQPSSQEILKYNLNTGQVGAKTGAELGQFSSNLNPGKNNAPGISQFLLNKETGWSL